MIAVLALALAATPVRISDFSGDFSVEFPRSVDTELHLPRSWRWSASDGHLTWELTVRVFPLPDVFHSEPSSALNAPMMEGLRHRKEGVKREVLLDGRWKGIEETWPYVENDWKGHSAEPAEVRRTFNVGLRQVQVAVFGEVKTIPKSALAFLDSLHARPGFTPEKLPFCGDGPLWVTKDGALRSRFSVVPTEWNADASYAHPREHGYSVKTPISECSVVRAELSPEQCEKPLEELSPDLAVDRHKVPVRDVGGRWPAKQVRIQRLDGEEEIVRVFRVGAQLFTVSVSAPPGMIDELPVDAFLESVEPAR